MTAMTKTVNNEKHSTSTSKARKRTSNYLFLQFKWGTRNYILLQGEINYWAEREREYISAIC